MREWLRIRRLRRQADRERNAYERARTQVTISPVLSDAAVEQVIAAIKRESRRNGDFGLRL